MEINGMGFTKNKWRFKSTIMGILMRHERKSPSNLGMSRACQGHVKGEIIDQNVQAFPANHATDYQKISKIYGKTMVVTIKI